MQKGPCPQDSQRNNTFIPSSKKLGIENKRNYFLYPQGFMNKLVQKPARYKKTLKMWFWSLSPSKQITL